MLILGLTGGIATGKSTVSRMIRSMGVPVICADTLAHLALKKGTPSCRQLVSFFGKGILTKRGIINRKKMGSLVFGNARMRKKLESFVHPFVIAQMKMKIQKYKQRGFSKLVLDIPLLFETGLDKMCDQTILVYAPAPHQKIRLKNRDKLDDGEIEKRLKSQLP